jgi:alpha-beta hydrolase superfamily lysophospholipase
MSTPIRAPHWMLLGTEPVRAAIEYLRMRSMDIASLPRGDGHPVVIFPGLAANEVSTGPLVRLCTQLGYAASDWGRGFNTGPRGNVAAWLDDLADHVDALSAGHTRTMSLIGWSLGGVIGPLVASALIGEEKAYTVAYTTIGIIALLSVALTFITKVPADRDTGHS